MRKIVKIFGAIICIACMLSLCGCKIFNYEKEKNAYSKAITTLFDALDNKDEKAIYNLFSPAVREKDKDLKQQIEKLLQVYQGPMSEIGWDGLLGGEYSDEYGEHTKEAFTVFPVRCGDTYYWIDMSLMYENTIDENQVGVVSLDFYTADESYIANNSDSNFIDSKGLEVYAEKTIDEDVRCIRGSVHKYYSHTEVLNIEEVKDFFKTSNSFDDFKKQFGEPNAENIYCYYELPNEENKPRYLEIGTNDDGTIYGADIVDDFKWIESIYSEEENNKSE